MATTARLLLDLQRPEEAIRLLMPWIRSRNVPHALVGSIADALYRLNRLRLLRRVSGRLLYSLKTSTGDEPLRHSLFHGTPPMRETRAKADPKPMSA